MRPPKDFAVAIAGTLGIIVVVLIVMLIAELKGCRTAHADVAIDTLALERARIRYLKPDVGLDSIPAPLAPAPAPKREHRRTELQVRTPATASAIPQYSLVATTDPNPKPLISSAPRFLEKRSPDGKSCCTADTILARTWPKLQIGLQARALDWAHPHFNPTVVATGPEIEPGHACTLFVAHGQPGDTFVSRWTNLAGGACWAGKGDSTSWRPLEAW